MTYKLLRHKDFTAEWEKLPSAIRDQFKKKLANVVHLILIHNQKKILEKIEDLVWNPSQDSDIDHEF